MHGTGADLRTFGYQLQFFAQTRKVIVYSRRYHHPNAGPTPGASDSILDALSREGVRATFFLTGSEMAANPGLADRFVREARAMAKLTTLRPNACAIAAKLQMTMAMPKPRRTPNRSNRRPAPTRPTA